MKTLYVLILCAFLFSLPEFKADLRETLKRSRAEFEIIYADEIDSILDKAAKEADRKLRVDRYLIRMKLLLKTMERNP